MRHLSRAQIFRFHAKAEYVAPAKQNWSKVKWIWRFIGDWNTKKLNRVTFLPANHIRKTERVVVDLI
jgi:hypothetical protein